MLKNLKTDVAELVSRALHAAHGTDHSPVMEVPPRRELGDLATPAPLHLAKELKMAPRKIAEETLAHLSKDSAFSSLPIDRVTVEGPGYLNFFLDRPAVAAALLEGPLLQTPDKGAERPKVIVEHTNINPNKAAHIGHLRNAVLGDILARSYRALGYPTEIQNYIDDTGVQVADVVVGFMDLRGTALADVEALEEPFDYHCWDLYSEVGRWFEEDTDRQQLRRSTLHELEAGQGDRAEMGRLVANRIVDRHLKTMARLDIDYDVLTRESEILGLSFFASAFEKLKEAGAIRLESEGKNEGCWVMPLSESKEFQGLEDPDKVIVRSDGTVTYVGKDIAYQLWKFGLLGLDFEYRPWEPAPHIWETLSPGQTSHPDFGKAFTVVNVIDARQSYLQKIVKAGLEALGHPEEAQRSVHFAYEMVSLSEKTARQLGFLQEDEEASGALEMSGRKGIGVKADDLLDQLIERSSAEIESRSRELKGEEVGTLAIQISVAALRYFMVKTTTTRVIAFDLDEALSFEGDSGPYLQYSQVRSKNIQRRLAEAGISTTVSKEQVASSSPELWEDDLWDLILSVGLIEQVVEKAVDSLELSLMARHAADLAQKFHAVYHRHPILKEEDTALRDVRLATTQIFQRGLEHLADLLGIPLPDRM